MDTCYIIAGGSFDGFFDDIKENDLVIAADKGFKYAKESNIEIDYAVGDFDSTKKPDFKKLIALNPIKDFTDTVAAIRLAIKKGYKNIIVYGGLGGKRVSHTISNIKSLYFYKKRGIDIRLKSKAKEVFIIDEDFSYAYKGRDFYVSVFSLSQSSKISIEGLYYELESYEMSSDDSLGVSNETNKKDFSIKVEDGYLLVIFEDFDR